MKLQQQLDDGNVAVPTSAVVNRQPVELGIFRIETPFKRIAASRIKLIQMSPDILLERDSVGNLEKSPENGSRLETNAIRECSTASNTSSGILPNTYDDQQRGNLPLQTATDGRPFKWNQFSTPDANSLRQCQAEVGGKSSKNGTLWNEVKRTEKMYGNLLVLDQTAVNPLSSQYRSSTKEAVEVCQNDGQPIEWLKKGLTQGRIIDGEEKEVEEEEKEEEEVEIEADGEGTTLNVEAKAEEGNEEQEAVIVKFVNRSHFPTQTTATTVTLPSIVPTTGHYQPPTTTTVPTSTLTSTTGTNSNSTVSVPNLGNSGTSNNIPNSATRMGAQNSSTNSDKLGEAESVAVEIDVASDTGDANLEDLASSSTSSPILNDQGTGTCRSENVDLQSSPIKRREDRQKNIDSSEEEEEEEEEEAEQTISPSGTRRLPIQLIRRPSEEGFHQVVKFTKHATRKIPAATPAPKPPSSMMSEEKAELPPRCEQTYAIPLENVMKNIELNEKYGTSVDQNSNLDVQPRRESCSSADEAHAFELATVDSSSSFITCGNVDLDSPICEPVHAKSITSYSVTSEAEGNLLFQQQVQEQQQHEQQEEQERQQQQTFGKADVDPEKIGQQADKGSKTSSNMQKTIAYEPARVQVMLKKKRCNECFADDTFDAADSATYQQQRSFDENRTFIINDPQHCSVSATLSLGRPKKLFFSKGRNAAKSTATATFQAATAARAHHPNTNDAKGILSPTITSNSTTGDDQKSPVITNFKTETIPSSTNHPYPESLNNTSISSMRQQQRSKTLPFPSAQLDSAGIAESGSEAKYPDAGATDVTLDVPGPNSTQSTLNSRESGGYRGDCSSMNSLHSSDYNKERISRRRNNSSDSRESFSNRLSRGFFDFTQGSSDRLQKWKSKLQNGRRHKDSSEPPPVNRRMPTANQEQNGHSSDVEVVLDWTTPKCDSADQARRAKFASMGSAFAPRITRPRVIQPTRSASDLCPTSENSARITLNAPDTIMEHRTLRQRDDNGPRTVKNLAAHFQNIKSVQTTAQTIESYDNLGNNLPPPVRITPYSGVKPKGSDIIRPVAFRPYVPRKAETRQTVTSSSSSYCSNNNTKNDNNLLSKRLSNSDDLKRPLQQVKDTMPNSSSSSSSSSNNNCRPRGIYQPSTSSELASTLAVHKKSSKFETEENDYDVVPECFERDKFYVDMDSTSSENYSVVHSTPSHRNPPPSVPSTAPPTANININRNKIQQQQNGGTTFGIAIGHSPQNLVKKSPSSHQVYGSNASSGSRHSSGIHVTPSPSDSGIVDYETIIRDKENELTNVRATMEQNEEVVVKVYLEKERLWKEQLADLRQKLQASQQGENALRQQIQRCNEQREQFQATIQNLTSDRQGLQRKCLQIERELFQLRERFDELMRNRGETICDSCRKHVTCNDSTSTNNNSIDKRIRPPVPTPRHSKDTSSERELRSEVDELRGEVSTLRDTLNEQINLFADERKRWEEERVKILKSNNTPSNRLGLLSTNDSSSSGVTSQLSGDLKILSDGKSYVVSRDRLI